MFGWNQIKSFFGIGTSIDYSPDANYRREAEAQVKYALEFNRNNPQKIQYPEEFQTWYDWYRNGKPRHIEPMLPGSDPRIDAAMSQDDPSYMKGTSEAEWVMRKRRGE